MIFWQDIPSFGLEIAKRNGCLLCVDWGGVYCGFAISDPRLTIATPLEVAKLNDAIPSLLRIAGDYGLRGVVVGLPVKGDFTGLHDQAKGVIEFAKDVNHSSGLPVLLWDERMSTAGAFALQNFANAKSVANNAKVRTRRLGGKTPRANKRKDDLAAQFILDGLLDPLRPFLVGG